MLFETVSTEHIKTVMALMNPILPAAFEAKRDVTLIALGPRGLITVYALVHV